MPEATTARAPDEHTTSRTCSTWSRSSRSSSRCASSPPRRTRGCGNRIGAAGMSLAIVVTLAQAGGASWLGDRRRRWRSAAVFGAVAARRVKMTAMPQMVALFNGVGGGAAALVSLAEFHDLAGRRAGSHGRHRARDRALGADRVGLVRRLDGRLREAPGADPGTADHLSRPAGREPRAVRRRSSPPGIAIVAGAEEQWLLVARDRAARSLFGVLFVLPIGGADMPVVISLLNAFTGLAAAATGFELENNVLIVSGDARRRLGNAAHDADGPGDEPLDRERPLRRVRPGRRRARRAAAASDGGTVRSATAEDVAIMLAYARKVVVRARLRARGRAGAARRARSSPTCSRRRASTSATRSIPSRAACPGT